MVLHIKKSSSTTKNLGRTVKIPLRYALLVAEDAIVGDISVVLGESFDRDFPLRLPGERSIEKDRISETPVRVNTTEKTTLLEFSIRLFVPVFVLGSQTISLRTQTHCWLTSAIFRSLP